MLENEGDVAGGRGLVAIAFSAAVVLLVATDTINNIALCPLFEAKRFAVDWAWPVGAVGLKFAPCASTPVCDFGSLKTAYPITCSPTSARKKELFSAAANISCKRASCSGVKSRAFRIHSSRRQIIAQPVQ